MNLSENSGNQSDFGSAKLLDYLLYSDPPTHHRTPCNRDLRPVLQSLQSVPESPQFHSLRKCVSRPYSPVQKGMEGDSCISTLTSPTLQNKTRTDSLDKQLALWKERAQVWGKEKRALEKRLEKVKNRQVLATQKSTLSTAPETDIRKINREVVLKRQEMKVLKQGKLIEELQEEVMQLRMRGALETCSSYESFQSLKVNAAAVAEFQDRGLSQELTLKQECEKWTKATELLRSELEGLKRAYQRLENAHESLITETADSRSVAIAQSQAISVLQSQLAEAKVNYRDLAIKYAALANAKSVQNDASLTDGCPVRKTNEEHEQRVVSLQKRYNETVGYFETDLVEKRRLISELLEKLRQLESHRNRLEKEVSALQTENALFRLKSQVKDVYRNRNRLSNNATTN